MVSLVIQIVRLGGRTDQQVDRKSVGDKTLVEVLVGRSPLDVHLPSGFGKQPVQCFRKVDTGRAGVRTLRK